MNTKKTYQTVHALVRDSRTGKLSELAPFALWPESVPHSEAGNAMLRDFLETNFPGMNYVGFAFRFADTGERFLTHLF